MFLYELPELEDVLQNIVCEDVFFSESDILDFTETIFQLLDDYLTDNPSTVTEPYFDEILLEEIREIIFIQLEDYYVSEDDEMDIDELLENILQIYITCVIPCRSILQDIPLLNVEIEETEKEIEEEEIEEIEKKINLLRNMPLPLQRTDEWYKYRHNLITASNAYKAFESQSMVNQLIYEKCQPLKINTDEKKITNTNTTLHWGQKYESLSVMIYENLYGTKVEDFGCIPHSVYKCLGASPDGIIVNKNSERYGRMLEIKNIVNREITGIPKKEYWIQMQLQMEVCDLDKCDFLETKFTEYIDSKSFYSDGDEKTIHNEMKGLILYFNNDSNPFYVYKPLNITKYVEIDKWMEEMIDLYQSKGLNWVRTIYWKLEKISCVLVLRNKEWFKNSVKQIEKVWNIIEKERITGYEHRAPNKKFKKDPFVSIGSNGCLLIKSTNV